MSEKKVLDYDPITGLKEIWHGSDDGNTFSIETVQDVQPLIDLHKQTQNHFELNRKSEAWHVASIPPSIQLKWRVEYGVDIFNKDHKEKVKRLLNDPEWKYLKKLPIQL